MNVFHVNVLLMNAHLNDAVLSPRLSSSLREAFCVFTGSLCFSGVGPVFFFLCVAFWQGQLLKPLHMQKIISEMMQQPFCPVSECLIKVIKTI